MKRISVQALVKTTKQLVLVVVAMAAIACQKQNSAMSPTASSTLQITTQQLGADSARIVNGVPVANVDPVAASTVALYLELKQSASEPANLIGFCSGTLIAKDIVLTAAHCFVDVAKELQMSVEQVRDLTQVAFGLPVITKGLSAEGVQLRHVQQVKVHAGYYVGAVNKAEKEAMQDIALIRMEQDAPEGYVPVPVSTDKDFLKKGQTLILAGYGVTNGFLHPRPKQLMKVDVKVDNPHLTETQFTYRVEQGHSSCSGDSGGPAYVNTPKGLMVVGLTSWGDTSCTQIGAYTSTAAMSDWMSQAISEMH
jgi:secreted trypsin-like serine protease